MITSGTQGTASFMAIRREPGRARSQRTHRPARSTRMRTALRVAVALAGWLLVAGALPAAAQDAASPWFERASRNRAKGQESAPLFVYEFADFQCPHCARFALEVFPRIDSTFVRTGKVHWVFVNLPLPNHENAWAAHEAALCAGAVADRFWAMHDRLFAAQDTWGELRDPTAVFARLAADAGVPAQPFAACTGADRVAPLILQ
ncbi:MAG: DsbA family protein, partial [Gemmatimonadetes bacterium]|nr:DsbA family protein [Gemmatimonadota bacterium]